MGLFSKDIQTMDDLFVHTLRDIYYAENQIVKALPDMIEKATDSAAQARFPEPLGRNQESL
jgi:ferritin-like metal-binding protein YciE